MFNKNSRTESADLEKMKYEIRKDVSHEYELRIQKLEADQSIALNEKDFEIKHLETEKMKELKDKVTHLEKELAVERKTNEMLVKITDLNADVIDVKELVTNLINKLPEVKISSLATTCQSNGSTK